MLPPSTLTRLLFPLGEASKSEVRAQAAELDLPGAQKGESQELCFVPTGRYDAFVAERAPTRLRPGPIVDASGKQVGEHGGIHQFTVGQRKNLGVALGTRAYVVGLDRESGTVRLGAREDVLAHGAVVGDVCLAPGVTLPLACQVRVRYRGKPVAATVHGLDDESATVQFDEAVSAVVQGQFCVFYDGDSVLGGGLIEAARQQESPC
jgi:tRNA-specific 2-thiouridylase